MAWQSQARYQYRSEDAKFTGVVRSGAVEAPNRLAEGMRFVLVNGVAVIEEGKMTGKLPGRVVVGQEAR